jgi:hypothetical protein
LLEHPDMMTADRINAAINDFIKVN